MSAVRFNMLMPATTLAKLDELRIEAGLDRSAFVRLLIHECHTRRVIGQPRDPKVRVYEEVIDLVERKR